jgi:hypothetical protein
MERTFAPSGAPSGEVVFRFRLEPARDARKASAPLGL